MFAPGLRLPVLLLVVSGSLLTAPPAVAEISQHAYVKASNTDADDQFGFAVAISGDLMVVGAPREDSSAQGVNGNESDDSATDSGAAYVFVRNGFTWSQEAYLKASNAEPGDRFGWSVAISGETVVIGAIGERSSATGANGDQSDNSATDAGAAYVFTRAGTTWSQQAYLKASNTEADDWFGYAVAIFGETIVASALCEDSGSPGVNGNQNDNSRTEAGAAYVFTRSGTAWSQQAYLKAPYVGYHYLFGQSVTAAEDTVVVGSVDECSSATGVNGNYNDTGSTSSGAAYVFRRAGTTWSLEAYLKASNTGSPDEFGHSVAMSGDTLVVSAIAEASNATGVNGNQNNNSASWAGAAYVFRRTGTTWVQEAYLKASNTAEQDGFGYATTISGERLVIGAPWEDSGATGVNGDQDDDSAAWSGAAYVFERSGSTWSQVAYLKASNTNPYGGDYFGNSVALSGDTLAIGAWLESGGDTGVNGDEGDDSASGSGAAYIVSFQEPGTGYCFGDFGSGTCPCGNDNDGSVPGSGCYNGYFSSGAKMIGTGLPIVTADTLVLTTTGLEPGCTCLYFQADNDLSPGLVWGSGLRCAGGNPKRLQTCLADASGVSSTSTEISTAAGNVTVGSTKYYQCWYSTTVNPPCGSGTGAFNSSNGYAVTWSP